MNPVGRTEFRYTGDKRFSRTDDLHRKRYCPEARTDKKSRFGKCKTRMQNDVEIAAEGIIVRATATGLTVKPVGFTVANPLTNYGHPAGIKIPT